MNTNKIIAAFILGIVGTGLFIIGGANPVIKESEKMPLYGAISFVVFGAIITITATVMLMSEVKGELDRREEERQRKLKDAIKNFYEIKPPK